MVDKAGLDSFCSSVENALLDKLDKFMPMNRTADQGGILKGGVRLINGERQPTNDAEQYSIRNVSYEKDGVTPKVEIVDHHGSSVTFFARVTVPNFDKRIFQLIRRNPMAVVKEFSGMIDHQVSARLFQDMHDVAICALRGAISQTSDSVYDLSPRSFVGGLIEKEKDRLPAKHTENTVDWLIHHSCALSYFGKNSGHMKDSEEMFITRDQHKNSFIVSHLDKLRDNSGRYYNIGAVPGAIVLTLKKFASHFDSVNDFYRAHWQYDVRVKNCRWSQRNSAAVEPTLDDLINPANWSCHAKSFDELPGIILVTR